MLTLTCFSYKGGAGRSTSAANLAAELARRDRKVAIVDADLGAPGLHYIFGVGHVSEDAGYLGTHHLVNDIVGLSQIEETGMIDVVAVQEKMRTWDLDPGRLFLLASSPGHRPGLDPEDTETAKICMAALRDMLEEKGFDYLIMDSASGTQQPIAGACMSVSDLVLVFFRWTLQHVMGTAECVAELLERQGLGDFTLATVATSVPSDKDLEEIPNPLLQAEMADSRSLYESVLAKVSPRAVPMVEIPEYTPFKWVESIAVFDTDLFVPLGDRVEEIATQGAGER